VPQERHFVLHIKQVPSAVIWRVYVVEAESKEAARGAPCTEEENYLGYFKGDSPSLPDEVSGPFESRETAMNSPEGWVEDV
jgi:hypothetical protein